jgi:pilus retraction protein PilT
MKKLVLILRRALFKEADRLCFRSFCRTTISKEGKRVFLRHDATEEDLREFLSVFCKEETLELGVRIISFGKIKEKKFYLIAYLQEEGVLEVDIFLGKKAKLSAAYEWMERETIKKDGLEEDYYKRLKSEENTTMLEEPLKEAASAIVIKETGVWTFNEETLQKAKEHIHAGEEKTGGEVFSVVTTEQRELPSPQEEILFEEKEQVQEDISIQSEENKEEISFTEELENKELKREEIKVSADKNKTQEKVTSSFDDMFGGGSETLFAPDIQEEKKDLKSEKELEEFLAPDPVEEIPVEKVIRQEIIEPLKEEVVLKESFYEAPKNSLPIKTSTPIKINYTSDLDGVGALGGKHFIDTVLSEMVAKRASDLHLTIGQPFIFRIDGEIRREGLEKLTPKHMESYVDSIIPKGKRAQFIETSDIDFAHEVKGKGRFRVNLYRDVNGVACVIRHIPDKIVSAEALNLPQSLIKFCGASKGLVLVTGPTGSGKSTTLAALLDYINTTRSDHILTIEDPIEFVYEQKKCLVNQREVSKHTDSFHAALRAALREDPDIILVGELRDLETTSHAVELAETGHLVFATLHTNSAISTIDRIIDMYPPEQQNSIRNVLAGNVRGIASQVLCKKIGGGRVAGLEVLVMDEAVSAMIRENKLHMVENHLKTHREEGNTLMADSLLDFVEKKIIPYEEAWAKATNKKSFEAQAERRNIKKN